MSYCSVVFLVCMWLPEAGITGSTGSVAVHNLWTRKGDTYCNDTCTKSITHSEGYEKVSWVFRLLEGMLRKSETSAHHQWKSLLTQANSVIVRSLVSTA